MTEAPGPVVSTEPQVKQSRGLSAPLSWGWGVGGAEGHLWAPRGQQTSHTCPAVTRSSPRRCTQEPSGRPRRPSPPGGHKPARPHVSLWQEGLKAQPAVPCSEIRSSQHNPQSRFPLKSMCHTKEQGGNQAKEKRPSVM